MSMKTNDAPERMWINPTIDLQRLSGHLDKNSIEYIRKDAFIKKACEWLKEHTLEFVSELKFGVGKTQPDYYTKHFIEDFKKYMEE